MVVCYVAAALVGLVIIYGLELEVGYNRTFPTPEGREGVPYDAPAASPSWLVRARLGRPRGVELSGDQGDRKLYILGETLED